MPAERIIHWKEEHRVHTYEVDFANRLHISAIFNWMQEAAANSANHLGFGYDDFYKDELIWVHSRVKLQLNEDKSLGEKLSVETWPRKTEGIFAVRDFKLYDAEGKVFCKATSSWLLLDLKSMRPVRVMNHFRDPSVLDDTPAIEELCGKIHEPEFTETDYETRIRYHDIDINRHVNHVKYIEFVLDAFPLEQYKEQRIVEMQLNFNHESHFGDELEIRRADTGQGSGYADGRCGGKIIFQAQLHWMDRSNLKRE